KHFVVDNQVYQTVGALPMVNQGRTDYAAIARGAGIVRTRTIESLDELEREMPKIASEDGPSFTVLRVEAETEFLGTPPMTYEGPEMKYRFGRVLEKRFGIAGFGPQGYLARRKTTDHCNGLTDSRRLSHHAWPRGPVQHLTTRWADCGNRAGAPRRQQPCVACPAQLRQPARPCRPHIYRDFVPAELVRRRAGSLGR